ncbi:hypothetical protein [Rhodococcus qingshengii]
MGTNEIETELRAAVQSALKTISDTFAPGLTFAPELVESLVTAALPMAKSLADPNFAGLVEELSVKCDRWSQWEEVVAVALAHLQSAGRLVSGDDIRLTTVQRSDVITVANYALQYGDSVTGEAAHRLVSRFPVTGPPAPPTQSAGGDCFDVCEGHPVETPVVHVHHHDIEAHAASFNEGYDEAVRQLAKPAEGPHFCRDSECGACNAPNRPAPAEPAEEETTAEGDHTAYSEAVSLSYWLAQQLGEHVDDAYDRGETLTDTVQRLIEHIRPNRGKTKTASSPVVPAPTETGPWQDWPSLDAIPADVRTAWDKSGDEWRRRKNGGWKFRSPGGKWQEVTLRLADFIDFAPFTTAAVAVWDPELGTRNDWTLNEGTDK